MNHPVNKPTIQSAQTRQMFAASAVSIATSTVLAAILAFMQRDVIDAAVVAGWFSLIVLVMLARAALVLAYQSAQANEETARVWLMRFRAGVLATSLVWGAAGFVLFPVDHPQHQMFLIFMLAGLTAGGVISYSADLFSGIVFAVSILAPLIVRLFLAGDSLSVAMAMAATLYLGFMIMSMRYISRNIAENIVLRLEAASREQIVRASEERYRLLLSHSPVGIFHYDTRLVISYCNDRFADILHSAAEQIVGLDMKLLKDQSVLPALQQALTGEIGNYEGPYIATFSDSNGWVAMTCAPSRDVSGNIMGGIAIVQDITDRKLAEQQLRIAATAFESQEGILITDADNVILRVNSAFMHITGYDAGEVIGKNPRVLSSGHHDATFYAAMWQAIHNDGSWEGEIWNRRKNGDIYPEHLTITSVTDTNDAITHYVATFNDITASKAAENEIRNLAFYDPLTGLPNRRLLMDRMHHALATSTRNGREGALLFIDLDNFKTLNDTLGHDVGDRLLQQVAQRLIACVRDGDTVARLGGDEFVVMLEGLSEQTLEAAAQTEAVGEKILAALNQPYPLAPHSYHNSPSIGAILFSDHHQAIDELLKHADIAMYQAKKAGRNTMRFFDPKMQETINARAALEGELRTALQNRQFHLHYQIQVDSSHHPLGAEALIRWQHPERGMISPAQFIPLAEESGLILPIGLWVLDTACAQINAWQTALLTRDLVLAVNVSARQFRQPDFVAQVREAIQRHAINPRRLKLELTESLLLDNIEDTIATMNALKAIGVRFSLDDFGTGYSSLQYLKRLPLDQLKIDQSFVRDIATDNSDRAIVRTIIAMARSLNLDVIAEGVESEEQRQLLLEKGCAHHQGYLFSRPVPVEQLEELLKQI
jgi:diguanylate cyclase (GGDEF)-like protein/PAS domain S-box-containing protein